MRVLILLCMAGLFLAGCQTNTDSIEESGLLDYPPSAEFLENQAAAGRIAYAVCSTPGGWSVHYVDGSADLNYYLEIVREDSALWDIARGRDVIGISKLEGPAVLVYSAVTAEDK